ncbi:hypothetical protein DXG01_004799 [Tephrocybe rancida]|nr:hypothetical protein DXG01_004799 [Tephrocybe rancida]
MRLFSFTKAFSTSKPSSGPPALSGVVMLLGSLAIQHLRAGPATFPAQPGPAVARILLPPPPPPPTLSIKPLPTSTTKTQLQCDEKGLLNADILVLAGWLGVLSVVAYTTRLGRFVDPPLLDCPGVVEYRLNSLKNAADMPAEDATSISADNTDNGDSDDLWEEQEVIDSLDLGDDPEPDDFSDGEESSDNDPTGYGGDEPGDNSDDNTEETSDNTGSVDPKGTGDDPEDPPPPSSSTDVDDDPNNGPLFSEDFVLALIDVVLICLLLYREALEGWLYRAKSVQHAAEPAIIVADVVEPITLAQPDVSTIILEAVESVVIAQPDDLLNLIANPSRASVVPDRVEPQILAQPDTQPALVVEVVEPEVLAQLDSSPKFVANPNPKPALVPYLSVTIVALFITLFNINFGNDVEATPEPLSPSELGFADDMEILMVEDGVASDIVESSAVLEITTSTSASFDETEAVPKFLPVIGLAAVVPIIEPEVATDIVEPLAVLDTTTVVADNEETSVEAGCPPLNTNEPPSSTKPSDEATEKNSTIAIGASEASPAGQIATTEDASTTLAIDASEALPAGHKVKATIVSSSMGAFVFKSKLPKREKRERAPREEVVVEAEAPSTQTGPSATMEEENGKMPEEDSPMGDFVYSERVPRRSKKARKGKSLPFVEWPPSTVEHEQATTSPVVNTDNGDEWSVVGPKRKQRKCRLDDEEGFAHFEDPMPMDFDACDSWAGPDAYDDREDGWWR